MQYSLTTPHLYLLPVQREVGMTLEERVAALLGQLTLDEKVALLAGASMWETVAIERLGIRALKVTDGPNGARGGGGFAGGVTSACFPAEIALAATWNMEVLEQVGRALGQEARTKGASLLLAPTVNIHRSPVNGRNFECFSEDPYLSARLAVAYIRGVQSQGIGTTIKHFIGNDSEYQRNSISSEIRERVLREIYLPPFQAAVQEAGSWALMASYNKVNGTFAGEHPDLLLSILKDEWAFDGIVMSDWFGTKSTAAAVNAGLDLEMPGPTMWRGEQVLTAVRAGEVSEDRIDDSVRRLLRLMARAGTLNSDDAPLEQAVNRPEHRAVARRAAAEGMVLLKNDDGILPLSSESRRIAIIGPNAKVARIMGGGSAQVNAHYAVTPYAGIAARVGVEALSYAAGCTNHRMLPTLDPAWLTPPDGNGAGLRIDYFAGGDLAGSPLASAVATTTDQMWFGPVAAGIDPRRFSARLSCTLTAPETGTFRFGLVSAGLSRLSLDGKLLIDNWTQQTRGDAYFGMGSSEVTATVDLVAGRRYDLVLEYGKASGEGPMAAVRLGCLAPVQADALDRAAEVAAAADVALVFVGLTGEWESEGFDRPDLELVGQQNALVERVAAANPNTVVVLQTGSPVSMPWLERVAGVLQAWYPGQECGNAIADVLFGDVNPSGKLPQTFPQRLEDNPAFVNYPGELGKVYYGEGIFVGYRYYEKKHIVPRFPFGFGLSYTTFAYANLQLSATEIGPDDTLEVTVDVTNAGDSAGQEVVQLYVRDPLASVVRPEKELKGFAKVALAAGETATVTLQLDRTSLAFYDDSAHQWVCEAGDYEVLVGPCSDVIAAQAGFRLRATGRFGGPPRADGD